MRARASRVHRRRAGADAAGRAGREHHAVLVPFRCPAAQASQDLLPSRRRPAPSAVRAAGSKRLVSKAGTDTEGVSLEIWGRSRLLKQLTVPKGLHGSIYSA